jgi:hydrophobic/amphiphilic exporter-1 (mainly G- bacteria), HAE1 family
MGLSEKAVVSNIITSLASDGEISPSYWVDPKSGNLYLLTVQFPDNTVRSLQDLKNLPIRSSNQKNTTVLGNIANVKMIESPTEVDHYKLRRVIDVYISTKGEELSRVATAVQQIVDHTKTPQNVVIHVRGIVGAMNSSLQSFGFGLILALVLVYLVLVAQFRSFTDPFLILLAVPPGVAGVLLILTTTGTTLNIMSLMGLVMMVGIVVSNSILIVEFTHHLVDDGMPVKEAVQNAVRVRLRPILMTSLATVIGLIPMALALEAGSESYAPLARAIIGGLLASVSLTVFIVPSAVYLVYRNRKHVSPSKAIAH